MTDAVASASASSTTTQTSAASAGLNENFELFLGLLTSQLQNQDPLDPLDSNQFVAQLVDFSAVEQAISQTEALEELVAIQAGQSGSVAVAYIGRAAAIRGETANLADGVAAWNYELPEAAADVTIRIYDESGDVVREQALGPQPEGTQEFLWDGTTDDGPVLAAGSYRMEVAAIDGEREDIEAEIAGYWRVNGVDFDGQAPELILGRGRAPLSDLIRLRDSF